MKAVMKAIEKITTNPDSIEAQELKKQIRNPDSQDKLVEHLNKLQEQKNITQEVKIFDFLIKELLECKDQTQDKEKNLFYLLNYWLLHIEDNNKINVFLAIAVRNYLLIALVDKSSLEFARSLLEVIQYLSLKYKGDYLNLFLNSYTALIGNNSSITPLMLASRKNNIDMILLLKEYGAIESLYQLEDKEMPEITAFQLAFRNGYSRDSRIKTAFYLWLNGAVMNFKINTD